MPRYLLVENTAAGLERFELGISDDGTYSWSGGATDPAGDLGGDTASGTWKRAGDTYTFTATAGRGPSKATVRGNELVVDGYGTFAAS